MSTKPIVPVYINYGRDNFKKTYGLFVNFLNSVSFENLKFRSIAEKPAAIIVSPRNNSGIPWCNLTIALIYAHKKVPLTIVFDDLNFLDPDWEIQSKAVEKQVKIICKKINVAYIKTSTQDDTPLDKSDYREIYRLATANGIWNVRTVVPGDKLNEYTKLSYIALEANAKKIKSLYSQNCFDHCVHQSLINNNGGLHKWFGNKFGMRVSCLDMSQGRGLVGIRDVPGYHIDLPTIIDNNLPGFLDTVENRKIAIDEAIKEHKLRISSKDSRCCQVVSTSSSEIPIEADIIFPINILWDAASLGRNQFFDSPFFWLNETIDFILQNTDAHVAVRQHPRERFFECYRTGKILGEYFSHRFGDNARFKFISSNENINTYLMIENCKVVLPYTSTVGIEAALMGKKVIIESNVYYKDQPFVIKANSKQDYFDKIKIAYEEPENENQSGVYNPIFEKAWLLYFLVTKCAGVFSEFGLEPLDFERWASKSIDLIEQDKNFMTAIEALISGKPYAYLNGSAIMKKLKNRALRIIDWQAKNNEEISCKLNEIIGLINQKKFEDALNAIVGLSKYKNIFLYPKAFTLAQLGHVEKAELVLNMMLKLKPLHRTSLLLHEEIRSKNCENLKKDAGNKTQRRVIGIVAPSYSGSTLLTAILGAHSRILGAGEVRWLLEKENFNVQRMIKNTNVLSNQQNTPWQDEAFNHVSYDDVYHTIFNVFDASCLVDSSKDIKYFKKIVEKNSGNGIDFTFIFLIKHPIRLVSSHLMHRWDRWEKLQNHPRNDAINYVINDVSQNLMDIHANLKYLEKEHKIKTVKYEDIVQDIRPLLNDLLAMIDLRYEEGMEKYFEKEQFILGGNAGPRYHIAKAQNGTAKDIKNPIQKEFYQNINGIEMDNNFYKVFSNSEITALYRHEKVQKLMELFQYSRIE